MSEKFTLDKSEIESPLWIRLSAEISSKIDLLRKQNDNHDKGVEETARLRGRIAALKELLQLSAVTTVPQGTGQQEIER